MGATNTGLQYLLTKAMIQTATALNVCQYLMIKADQASSALNDEDANAIDGEDNIKNHPVISRLNQLNHLADKLNSKVESKVDGLDTQFENLVKASALMQGVADEDDDTSEPGVEEAHSGEDSEIDYDAMLAKGDMKTDAGSDSESTASTSDDDEMLKSLTARKGQGSERH